MLTLANFIDNEHLPPSGGRYLDSIDPATDSPFARVPDSSPDDVSRAVAAASRAFPAWAATPASERSRLLLKLADLVDANLDRLAAAESTDSGKPIAAARSIDIPRSADNLRFFATAILHTHSEFHDADGGSRSQGGAAINYTLRKPRGVAGVISPWNLPLHLFTWKLAPALATGNTVVGKPSEVTPVTAHILGELAREAGFPKGVLNIIHGTGAGAGGPLVTHPDVPTISFTGSTATGQWIGEHAGRMLKRISLELGGKNPFLIFADADLDLAIQTAARAAFSNQGQICLCGSRLLVERSIFPTVLARLTEIARTWLPGDPSDSGTRLGSLVSRAHHAKVAAYVDLARSLGGTIHCGGASPDPSTLPTRVRKGAYYLPTVISGLDPNCRVEQEEIFGPVVTLQPFDSDDHAIALANGTPYGLAATAFTRDVSRTHRLAARLEAGILWFNTWLLRDLRTPFGGMKHSGLGREGGLDALKFFTEPKNVCIAL